MDFNFTEQGPPHTCFPGNFVIFQKQFFESHLEIGDFLINLSIIAFFKLERSQWKYLQDVIQPAQKYCSFHLSQSKDEEIGLDKVIDKMNCVVKFIQAVVGKIKRETHLELHLYLEGQISSDKKWDEWSLRKSREIMVLL